MDSKDGEGRPPVGAAHPRDTHTRAIFGARPSPCRQTLENFLQYPASRWGGAWYHIPARQVR